MDPEKVAADESRRIAQHERIKGKLEEDVHARIEREAAQTAPSEQAEVEAVASHLKHKATAEVAETENELQRARHTWPRPWRCCARRTIPIPRKTTSAR